MAQKTKQLSNPFSTGGGGAHFESHVQASFVTLMLSGGYAPCLPCWPIVEIKLQGKVDGFETDDFIAVVENPESGEQRKILGQVKHSITITQGSAVFADVITAAWRDFNNAKVFKKGKDAIGLFTGPLSATDERNVKWLLNQARHTKNTEEFFRNVKKAKFSPPKSTEKLEAFEFQLKQANNGVDVPKESVYEFLNHFHLLGYDLGTEHGVVLSLVHSHIGQFHQSYPEWIWSRVVEIVQTWNQDAGTITPDRLPEDLREAFRKKKAVAEIPEELLPAKDTIETDWANHPDAAYLALAILLGSWDEKSNCDTNVVSELLGIDYDIWLEKARDILHLPHAPLQLKNGIWKVVHRTKYWTKLASRVLDQNLDTFKTIAVKVLKEPDPAFDLPPEERFAASIHGKVLDCSQSLRSGIAEGLAILGTQADSCSNCSRDKAASITVLAVREILANAEWNLWGSLNRTLPTLAEAAPSEFLDAFEGALGQVPNPFTELLRQEDDGVFATNYLIGLLWALEGLAWDEQLLVRVCVGLGELAKYDPSEHRSSQVLNSLTTILLPWMPQTIASLQKRKVAIETLFNEQPNVAWNLVLQLLPGKIQSTSGTHKPNWRKTIPEEWQKGVSRNEYWEQVKFCAELAVNAAGNDIERLARLIDNFDNLPRPAFEQLVDVLNSQPIAELSEEQRLVLWNRLNLLTNKHRKYSEAKWALPDELLRCLENVASNLAPTDPVGLYQPLFSDRDFDLYDEIGNWEEQRKKLRTNRDAAISEIFQISGIEGVIQFSEAVVSPQQVGNALGAIPDDAIEAALLPSFLDTPKSYQKALASGFIWRRYQINGWNWCDTLDTSTWTPGQIGDFLASLPFTEEAWNRSSEWLKHEQVEYWSRTAANAYQADSNLELAINKLLEHGRPHAAIHCFERMLHDKQPINVDLCVKALLQRPASDEPSYAIDSYVIGELIKYLQQSPSTAEEDLLNVEWAYLPLLDRRSGTAPQTLERRLANDPDFFCEVIQLVYRSKREESPREKPTSESKAKATNAWRLLHEWNSPPGVKQDGKFSEEDFKNWILRVNSLCEDSGHLEVAQIHIGEVLVQSPADLDGLWINRTIATVLNNRDAEDMRRGFSTGIYNLRGTHQVDPSATPELELASNWQKKAEDVENAGFQRIAATLRKLAEGYEREAERIIDEHRQSDSEMTSH